MTVLVAVGVAASGERRVLGVDLGGRQRRGQRLGRVRAGGGELLERGLAGTRLVVSDAHRASWGAVRSQLLVAAWQRSSVGCTPPATPGGRARRRAVERDGNGRLSDSASAELVTGFPPITLVSRPYPSRREANLDLPVPVGRYLLDRHSPATAHARYAGLQAFFRWAVEEELIAASPMARMRPPKVPEQPPAILREPELRALLRVVDADRTFAGRRDAAILRLSPAALHHVWQGKAHAHLRSP